MSNLKNNEYIVFQPDQVLTNDHLNQLFYYLDRQNRLTRNKLIGMGIVCGLDLVITLNSQGALSTIEITEGCGVSSQGYLLMESTCKTYAYAVQYTPLHLPQDLPFTCPVTPFYIDANHTWLNPPIYKLMTCHQYEIFRTGSSGGGSAENPCAPASPVNGGSTGSPPDSPINGGNAQPFPLSNPPQGVSWSNYVVVLFLEANELDLKNCDMQDCNNKGEKMVFHLRPLLVPKAYLDTVPDPCGIDESRLRTTPGRFERGHGPVQIPLKAPEIRLRRYNVGYAALSNSAEILNAFETLTSVSIIDTIANAYHYCFEKYKCLLGCETSPFSPPCSPPSSPSSPPDFSGLQVSLLGILHQITTNSNRITIQYFYDYLNDLILAYYEFREAAEAVNTQCCPDLCAFPLHLMLGEATLSTPEFIRDPWRQYFIYSALFDGQTQAQSRMRFYFKRMEIMAAKVAFPIALATSEESIRITPSQYQEFPLSERAIPYYYPEDPTDLNSLYQYWSYDKTIAGDAAFNLSYNANLYNQYDILTNNPLEFDIEIYHFFRIEGHIGLPYQNAMNRLLYLRKTYNLPFDIVALSSQLLPRLTVLPTCNFLDLETDLRLLRIEYLCKAFRCIYKLSQLPYGQAILANQKGFNPADLAKLNEPSDADLISKLPDGSVAYQYGDFLNFFSPAVNTVGQTYQGSVNSTGVFTNPIDSTYLNREFDTVMLGVYSGMFSLLNAGDNLFYTLLNNKLADLTLPTLTSAHESFATRYSTFRTLVSTTVATADLPTLLAEIFGECGCDCLICLLEELLMLRKEYERRLQLYESQLEFVNYFLKHPGLEHKAGVPKGGTFVLVYNDERLKAGQPGVDENATALTQISDVLKTTIGLSRDILNRFGTIISEFGNSRLKAFPIPEGAVIADFYIPYLCCSDCSPIAYIINNVQPAISVANTNPCSDTASFPVTVSPVDTTGIVSSGTLSAAIIHNADNSWSFDPSQLFPAPTDPAYVQAPLSVSGTLVYTLSGVSSPTIKLTVYRHPLATFTGALQPIAGAAAQSNQLQVASSETNAALQYGWTVTFPTGANANPEPTGASSTVPVQANSTAAISLIVTNGNCSATVKNTIPAISVTSPLCNLNQAPVVIGNTIPQGTATSNPAGIVSLDPQNGWVFDPSKVAFPAGTSTVPVQVGYSSGGMTSLPITVQVVTIPGNIQFTAALKATQTPAGEVFTVTLNPTVIDVGLSYSWTSSNQAEFPLNSNQVSPVVDLPTSFGKTITRISVNVTMAVKNATCAGYQRIGNLEILSDSQNIIINWIA
ncbi:MAG TPA: hypothetical protein VG101_06580 [Puia sp.]|jgi:hypothetical protein|nr:hypothetical protein [Puia sp.]